MRASSSIFPAWRPETNSLQMRRSPFGEAGREAGASKATRMIKTGSFLIDILPSFRARPDLVFDLKIAGRDGRVNAHSRPSAPRAQDGPAGPSADLSAPVNTVIMTRVIFFPREGALSCGGTARSRGLSAADCPICPAARAVARVALEQGLNRDDLTGY